MSEQTNAASTQQPFQAEVAQLLKLMVHSVYSETDISLRELIFNASDAGDKLRYEAVSTPNLLRADEDQSNDVPRGTKVVLHLKDDAPQRGPWSR